MRANNQLNNKTYSQVTQQQPPTSTLQIPPSNKNEDTFSKIFTCVIHAHMQNNTNPGSYETELNKTLKLNKLPEIKIASNPDSHKIITSISTYNSNSACAEPTTSNNPTITNEEDGDISIDEDNISVNEEKELEPPATSTPNESKIQASNLGFTIFTSETTGWPPKKN
ncbi:hypothetical protein E2C01_034345 [Portunus trituberculatus]|uniref:Uncharacterized protein n=1 Tax=Portunus trituberculatus TaxID=210409 RepID=A0A5B7F5H3_PORTR|nr:hypothetical protein [Portunus trituberculatus]